MKKTYNEWIHWLESRNIMPQIRPGLKHTESALNEAGVLAKVDPQKVIHIAGTNGKGTTAKTLERLLSSQGLKVGLYTSPHLIETTERICINDKQITKDQLVAYCERYQPLIEKWNLSHFESLTLFSASLFFKDEPVDYAIYEIGLGGTWDATNVIPHNTSVITTLGFDHQHILGNTLREIADNKFGIIKNNNVVFHLPYNKDIEEQLQEKLLLTNSKAYKITSPELVAQKTSTLPKYFIQHNNQLFEISLPGPRAAQNMWLALQVFSSFGFKIESGLRELKKIPWPARMTLLSPNTICPVYLSGDHNLQGLDSLKEILKDSTYSKIKILLGLSKNRSHEEFIQSLKEIPNSEIYLTKPQFNGAAPTNSNLPYFLKPADGLRDILKNSKPDDMIVVTGSLYLCGDILKAGWS